MIQTIAPQMTDTERLATVAFHSDLIAAFDANARVMWEAKSLGDDEGYNKSVEETRRLYRDIKEVEHVLTTGVLPF